MKPCICFAVSFQEVCCCLFTSSTIILISSLVSRQSPVHSLIIVDSELNIWSCCSTLQKISGISLQENSGFEKRPSNIFPASESSWLKGSSYLHLFNSFAGPDSEVLSPFSFFVPTDLSRSLDFGILCLNLMFS